MSDFNQPKGRNEVSIPNNLDTLTEFEKDELKKKGILNEEGKLTELAKTLQQNKQPQQQQPSRSAEAQEMLQQANSFSPIVPQNTKLTEADVRSLDGKELDLNEFVNSKNANQEQEISDENEEEITEEVTEELEEFCPRCGWNTSKPFSVDPTEEDKISFVRSVLGNKQFTKEMYAMGDKLIFTFRSLKQNEIDAIAKQVDKDLEAAYTGNTTENDQALASKLSTLLAVESAKYSMVFSLLKVNDQEFTPPELDGKDLEVLREEFNKQFNGQVYSIMMLKYFRFEELINKLSDMAENPNFWRTTDESI